MSQQSADYKLTITKQLHTHLCPQLSHVHNKQQQLKQLLFLLEHEGLAIDPRSKASCSRTFSLSSAMFTTRSSSLNRHTTGFDKRNRKQHTHSRTFSLSSAMFTLPWASVDTVTIFMPAITAEAGLVP
jgi:hypothetical protein